MDLVRDLLDKQVVDGERRKMGRVDGIVLLLRQGRAPRVGWLEIGPATLASRLHRGLGEWFARLERRLGVSEGHPTRVPWERVEGAGLEIHADVDARRTSAYDWEIWLRDHVVRRIPGGKE